MSPLRVASDKTTTERIVDPFRRSGKMGRSPLRDQIADRTGSSKKADGSKKLLKLKGAIEGLQEYVKDRHNVHQEIKRMIVAIKSAYNDLEMEISTNEGDETSRATRYSVSVATQTVEMLTAEKTHTGQRLAAKGPVESPLGGAVKRFRRKESDQPVGTPAKKGRSGERGDQEKYAEQNRKHDEWRLVHNKKKTNKTSRSAKSANGIRSRPDAIIIGANGGMTYADILRKVKNDPTLTGLGEKVTRIRRTQKGEMLLELRKSETDDKGSQYGDLVKKALGEQAEVKSLSPETLVECRDLDEITTKEDVCQALTSQLGIGKIDESAIRSIRKAYGGTQRAIISLPIAGARVALKEGKIKIGWSVCKIRQLEQIKRCFRCWETGHMAKNCKNDDRSKLCRRCGKEGHIAKACTLDPKCVLCEKIEGQRTDHISGSARCIAHKMDVNKTRK